MTHPPLHPAESRTPLDSLRRHFVARFGADPELAVRAPGRVNLIGEHTDYNDGFVLPIALDRDVTIALRPRADDTVVVYSLHFDERATFSLSDLQRGGPGWAEYLKATAWALEEAGYALRGWEGVLTGEVPVGAGLSSSAALELATARAFAAVSGLEWDPGRMARVGQRAENEWVGLNCGIMDQLISAVARAGHAALIDCRTLAIRHAPLPPGAAVVILDTGTRRRLTGSGYNSRREECERAAAVLGVPALRDATPAMLDAAGDALDPTALKRARHVVTENQRVLDAVEAMERGDAVALGRLMDASHESLRDDFEVSSPALDAMVAAARRQPGCYGARMTGAGFGGCAVALVHHQDLDAFVERVGEEYREATGESGEIYVCSAGEGAGVVPETGRRPGDLPSRADRQLPTHR